MSTIKNLKEFAQLAGVSTATVSRALSRTGRVSEETRQRISDLADRLGYQPNVTARNLRTQRTMTIGVLVPLGHETSQHLSDPFFNTMTGFLADELSDHGYDLLLSRVLPKSDRWLDRYIGSGKVDGILVIGQSTEFGVIETVSRRYLPMVVWGGLVPGQNHCSVGTDNRQGGALATRHLIARGCRRIAFAGPTRGPEFGERLDGVKQALREAGQSETLLELPSHFEPNAAYADILDQIGRLDALPDGIVAGSDVTAIGVLRALGELGIDVPGRIKLVGYDGLPVGAQVSPPLTTIDQQLRQGAAIMVELLLRRLAGQETESRRIEPKLIVRASA
ncbi:LacI family DNA-binding transcriptional regulator [uncultured Sphingomonas sp.]|uniref:LacI family DNA-binding transcriptional regulator n=1 Tax=uncultured Sphingomonas sp. TaxID=158754 RepID=UPI0025F716CB|nr:LacI family DNA-binding transcriptional regulator [uncultured Sphingomonas sp.]